MKSLAISRVGSISAIVILSVCTVGLGWHQAQTRKAGDVDVVVEDLPMQLGEWTGQRSKGLDARSQLILSLDRHVKRIYTNPNGHAVSLYIGYWRRQTGDSQAGKHSPPLCLPANGWKISRPKPWSVPLTGERPPLTTSSLIGEIDGRKSLFKYWFFMGEETFRDESQALLKTSLAMLRMKRSDGGIIELITPLNPTLTQEEAVAEANDALADFTQALYPELQKLIRRGSSQRSAGSELPSAS